MPSDYRYDPFNNIAEPIAITGETHVVPSNSPYTIRLAEVPVRESPSTVTLTIAGIAATEVAAEPAAGQFRCDYTTNADSDENWNTGLIQFNASDAGKTVVAAYNGLGTLASANYRGHQLFTASGAFVVPKGVTQVFVTGCGGGGSGARNDSCSDYTPSGGGAGACAYKTPLTVVPGQSYAVTIGSGGAQSTTGAVGNAGGTTSFGALLSLTGGGGGTYNGGSGGASGGAYATRGEYGDNTVVKQGGSGLFGKGGTVYSGGVPSGFGAGGTNSATIGIAGGNSFLLVEW